MDKETAILIQRALREIVDKTIGIDGDLGPKSLKALKKFAEMHGFAAPVDFNASAAMEALNRFIEERYVTSEAYVVAAKRLGCKLSHMRAIAEVESKKSAFLPSGNVTILYERHKFYKYLKEALNKSDATRQHVATLLQAVAPFSAGDLLTEMVMKFPGLCNPQAGGYKGDEAEFERLRQAATFDPDSAYMSASYGGFQIMGFNYSIAGYKSAWEMLKDYTRSEKAQFDSFVTFILNSPHVHRPLKAGIWADVARGYNGADYAINQYDKKLAAAQKKWAHLDQ